METLPKPIPISAGAAQKKTFQFSQQYSVPSAPSIVRDSKVGISSGKFRPIQECSAIKFQSQETVQTEPTPETETLLIIKKDPDSPDEKFIPKLIDSPPCVTAVDPQGWTMEDVSKFLMLNDCGAYCDSFHRNVSLRFFSIVQLSSSLDVSFFKFIFGFSKCRKWMEPSF